MPWWHNIAIEYGMERRPLQYVCFAVQCRMTAIFCSAVAVTAYKWYYHSSAVTQILQMSAPCRAITQVETSLAAEMTGCSLGFVLHDAQPLQLD